MNKYIYMKNNIYNKYCIYIIYIYKNHYKSLPKRTQAHVYVH
jgi:hypothetical protein